jgi:hypothetical protein
MEGDPANWKPLFIEENKTQNNIDINPYLEQDSNTLIQFLSYPQIYVFGLDHYNTCC